MRNILAVAHKELRAYFASPIAYIVIGFFALLFGIFFVAILRIFVSQSMQAGLMGGAQAMNVNQQLIRPLLQNVAVVVLFMLPMVTSAHTRRKSARARSSCCSRHRSRTFKS